MSEVRYGVSVSAEETKRESNKQPVFEDFGKTRPTLQVHQRDKHKQPKQVGDYNDR